MPFEIGAMLEGMLMLRSVMGYGTNGVVYPGCVEGGGGALAYVLGGVLGASATSASERSSLGSTRGSPEARGDEARERIGRYPGPFDPWAALLSARGPPAGPPTTSKPLDVAPRLRGQGSLSYKMSCSSFWIMKISSECTNWSSSSSSRHGGRMPVPPPSARGPPVVGSVTKGMNEGPFPPLPLPPELLGHSR